MAVGVALASLDLDELARGGETLALEELGDGTTLRPAPRRLSPPFGWQPTRSAARSRRGSACRSGPRRSRVADASTASCRDRAKLGGASSFKSGAPSAQSCSEGLHAAMTCSTGRLLTLLQDRSLRATQCPATNIGRARYRSQCHAERAAYGQPALSTESALDVVRSRIAAEPDPTRRVEMLVSALADAIKETSNDQNVQKLVRALRASASEFAATIAPERV